jgi:hypothetical protein
MRCAITTLAFVGSFVVTSAGQTMTDTDIDAAIKAGLTKYDHLVSRCTATVGFGASGIGAAMMGGIQPTGGFDVTVSTNAGRVAYLAADAKRLYKPFSAADVPESLKQPAIFVFADPMKPSHTSNMVAVAAPVDRIVLKSKAQPNIVVQPETFETEPVEWSNLLGGKVQSTRGLALFAHAAVKELRQVTSMSS